MNPLFVGIDVGSQNNAVYLMKPDGSKYSSFSVQNNRGGAKRLTEKIVSAVQSQGLTDVVTGKESYSDLPKNDNVDAFVIADKLRFGRITKEVYMDDYRCKALQTLTRARFYAVQDLAREKQRFAN